MTDYSLTLSIEIRSVVLLERRSVMLAKDIMTQHVIAVSPQTPVKQLAKTLSQNHISGTPVVDKRGKVVGVVTERDLLGKKGTQVKSIMSKKVISVMEDTPVEEI